MVLDEIVLHNFGIYRGRQTLKLTPPSPEKSIILIGGLNGGGKTTLLDALQLVLYGKFARCSNRGSLAYDEFLRRCVHRAVSPYEGAALEVQFRYLRDGKEHTYRVHRSWALSGTSMRERLEVLYDGLFDRALTETWQEHIETFIPVRLSQLFFFDGEKIEALADVEHAAQLLTTAIHALLGLDLVEQLDADLLVLERRKRTEMKGISERQEIDHVSAEIAQLDHQRENLITQRAALQNEVDRRRKRLHEIDTRFQLEGGALLEQRERLEQERATLSQRLHAIEEELRQLAAGPAPLLLLSDLLETVVEQDRREEAAKQAQVLTNMLAERDARLLEEARIHGAQPPLLETLMVFLVTDRQQRMVEAEVDKYLNLHPEARDLLRTLYEHTLKEVGARVSLALEASEKLRSHLADLDRQLASIPDREGPWPHS
ncbi:MAG: hypothetical protein KatS3mg131_1125 [Candidatus Tectimicrobiota bacterium]|nr:MAG: hypothetical protein KatS3mg131_1125 [Candidatus Tectomicrobia bacterium]